MINLYCCAKTKLYTQLFIKKIKCPAFGTNKDKKQILDQKSRLHNPYIQTAVKNSNLDKSADFRVRKR